MFASIQKEMKKSAYLTCARAHKRHSLYTRLRYANGCGKRVSLFLFFCQVFQLTIHWLNPKTCWIVPIPDCFDCWTERTTNDRPNKKNDRQQWSRTRNKVNSSTSCYMATKKFMTSLVASKWKITFFGSKFVNTFQDYVFQQWWVNLYPFDVVT